MQDCLVISNPKTIGLDMIIVVKLSGLLAKKGQCHFKGFEWSALCETYIGFSL